MEVRDVVCTVCGCCCDDLIVEIEDNHIKSARNACTLSTSKLMDHRERLESPMIREGGILRDASLEEALDRAAQILSEARYPLLWGWSLTCNEAVSIGVELAEVLGGVIDNNTSICHGPGLIGVHDIGISSSTLGEVKNRADLIVYWGSNPVHAHPRHMARYTVMSRGRFRRSRRERTLIVVDVRRTDTARLADLFIQVKPNGDYELLSALRAAVKGEELEQEEVAGVPVAEIERMTELMIGCEFGALFYGVGLTMSRGKSRNIDAALSLVRDLNSRTKFTILPMRGHFNVTGANEVTTWLSGYPFGVDYSRGYPYYNPGDTTAIDILRRGECDAALVVASDPAAHFPASITRRLMEIPIITLDPYRSATAEISEVVIPTAVLGVEALGTIYRMDGVPLEAKRLVEPPEGVKTDVEILSSLLERVKILRG